MPDVYRRQHIGFEVHGSVHHAPARAAVAHAAALAREGDEIACLIDFGVEDSDVLKGLRFLPQLQNIDLGERHLNAVP